MYNPSREQARQFFLSVWQKQQQQAPLSALEAMAWDILRFHPEYHALLGAPERALTREWFPEQGATNPFLHLGLHLALEEQLAMDQPPGIVGYYKRWCERLQDEHAARHRLQESLAELLWSAQRHGTPLSSEQYLVLLEQAWQQGQ